MLLGLDGQMVVSWRKAGTCRDDVLFLLLVDDPHSRGGGSRVTASAEEKGCF